MPVNESCLLLRSIVLWSWSYQGTFQDLNLMEFMATQNTNMLARVVQVLIHIRFPDIVYI